MNAASDTPASRRVLTSGRRGWHLAFLAALAATVTLLAAPASAQGNGSITGVVTDPTGAVVQGAKVTATRVGTGDVFTTTTSKEGIFVFPSLRPARYDLAATAAGFSVSSQTGIVLQADAALTINVALGLGGATETVTVEANATQVNLTTQTLAQVIDEKRVQELPLNGRNAAALTTLVAGVVDAPTAQAAGHRTGSGELALPALPARRRAAGHWPPGPPRPNAKGCGDFSAAFLFRESARCIPSPSIPTVGRAAARVR